jgi:hypothetical protein
MSSDPATTASSADVLKDEGNVFFREGQMFSQPNDFSGR